MEYELLNRTSLAKFRSVFDVNQWAIADMQLVTGNFSVKGVNDFGRFYSLKNDNTELYNYINSKDSTVVCINDTNTGMNFDKVSKELIEVFEKKFPDKSSFEK